MQDVLEAALQYGRQYIVNGRVAHYIPELAKAEQGNLGGCIITTDNKVYTAGDCDKQFSIQSVSKVPTLMYVLNKLGDESLFQRVGMEPTGDAFNSIKRLEVEYTKPSNPLINAGAIVVVSCISGKNQQERFGKILEFYRAICGNPSIDYSREIYESESKTGDRNRAIAYMLKANGIIYGDVEAHLEIYFKLCSILVTCRDIARMAAALANDGRCVKDGRRYLDSRYVRIVRSLMVTCGMYNFSGAFATEIGIPSKSGVGGGILSVVPNKMGIGVYGPALDEHGNSVGGMRALKRIVEELDLSIF